MESSYRSLVPRYSLEDTEGFVHATKLCARCHGLLLATGPYQQGSQKIKSTIYFWREGSHSYEHHPSFESLAKAVNVGCTVCAIIRDRLVHNHTMPSTSTRPEDRLARCSVVSTTNVGHPRVRFSLYDPDRPGSYCHLLMFEKLDCKVPKKKRYSCHGTYQC